MDRAKITELVVAEIPRLRRFARFLTHDLTQADYFVEECLSRALSRFDGREAGTSLRAWLMAILYDVFRSALRRVGEAQATVRSDQTVCTAGDVADRVLAGELASVQRAFRELAEEHRQILLLCAVEDLKYREVAAILKLPIGTVRSRLSRARAAMRNATSGAGDPDRKKPARHIGADAPASSRV
jgi:RNA polymerase sigma-70 factor (ECF subfamily)